MNSIATALALLLGAMLRSAFAFVQPSRVRASFSLMPSHHVVVSPRMPFGERLYSTSNKSSYDGSSLSSEKLINLAKQFINNRNAAGCEQSTLDDVFDMCSPSVDLYGLKGDDVRPGFTSFFQKHVGLHHELLDEPVVVGSGIVQYPFTKQFKNEDGEEIVWKSIDMAKPRNKVERVYFDGDGKIDKVSVVEADAPLD